MGNKPPRQPMSQFLIFATLKTLLFFSFLGICATTVPFPNFDLSSTILDPTKTGFTVTGKSAAESFARSVKTAGDVNGDGYDDFIIGGVTDDAPGKAYVIYGGPNSLPLQNINFDSITLDPATTGFTISGTQQNDAVGSTVSGAGDFNNDGYDDILVSTGLNKGEVYVIYGRESSELRNIVIGSTVLDPATTGFTVTQNANWDGFGNSLSTAGDVDGDGFDDIMIGAPRKTAFYGAVYVIYGRDKSEQQNIALTTNLIPAIDGFMMLGNSFDGQLGFSVSSAGDIDGDGYDDIVIGAQGKNQYTGAVYVIYGGPRSSLQNIALSSAGVTLSLPSAGFFITGIASNDRLGCSVSTAGDFNHDGFDDIIIGAYGSQGQGAAYVIYGGPRSTLQNIALSSSVTLQPAVNGFTITAGAVNDNLGISVSTAGDVNGDGYSDIIIGADGKSGSRGAAYVIYGRSKSSAQNLPLASVILDPVMSGFTITGSTSNDGLGYSVSTAGDVNGDGYDDLIIGTKNKKMAYVIHAACVSESGSSPCTKRNFCQACTEEANPLSLKCQTCPSNCEQYMSPKACEICDQGFFVSTSTSLCESCSANCQQCRSSTVCEICKETYFLYQSKCFKPCPLGTFDSEDICEDCSSHCSLCTSLESCQTCDDGYYLYKSQCFETCPGGTFSTAWNCFDCSPHCSSCTSPASCQTCELGFTLINSQCATSSPTAPSTLPPLTLKVENTAIQRLGSSVTGVGSAISVGNPTFPLTKIVSKIVQNTRYLNLPVTPALAEIYQTWDADLISWDYPENLSKLDHFKTTPPVFAQYEIGSPFSFNFWSTIITIAIALCVWIVVSMLLCFFERKKTQGKIYSLLEILAAGSLNFALVQAYGCLDDIILYFLLDLKTNPYNSIFAWVSFACGVTFLSLGVLFMLLNIFKVRKYQKLKREGLAKKDMRELEIFSQKNKKWELFYADFNDHDVWSHSFLAFLIVRSCLSSLIIASLHEHILIQTISLLVLDVIIILFLIIKKPFVTLRGKLAQYYFEIITLPVHICTFILALQTRQSEFSPSLNDTLCTCIIYLNTALITGTTGFMFIEIYKTISQWMKSQRNNAVHPMTEEASSSNPQRLVPAKKFANAATNTEQNLPLESFGNQTERFHLLPGFDQSQNISFSGVTLQNSEIENSLVPDLDSSDQIIPKQNPKAIARRRLLTLTDPQKNKSVFTAHAEEVDVMELEII